MLRSSSKAHAVSQRTDPTAVECQILDTDERDHRRELHPFGASNIIVTDRDERNPDGQRNRT
jgi:hypothetical protein